jgi:hypothetical protein
VEHAAEVHLQHSLPGVRRTLVHWPQRLFRTNAGVVDQNINAAERLNATRNQFFGKPWILHRTRDCDRSTAVPPGFLDDRLIASTLAGLEPRALMTTCAPWAASSKATERPIDSDEPVTTARLPLSFLSTLAIALLLSCAKGEWAAGWSCLSVDYRS